MNQEDIPGQPELNWGVLFGRVGERRETTTLTIAVVVTRGREREGGNIS